MTTILTRWGIRNRVELPSSFMSDPLMRSRDEFDKVLSALFAANLQTGPLMYSPLLDLTETYIGYQVHADLTGNQPKEINVQVSDNVVTISGGRN